MGYSITDSCAENSCTSLRTFPEDPGRPLASIILFNYTHSALIPCLEHIFSQTQLLNFEVVICDDHTTDGSWEAANGFMRRFPDRITLSRSQAVFGPLLTERKLTLQMVRGRYYVLLTENRTFDPAYVIQTLSTIESDPLFVHAYIGLLREYRLTPIPYKLTPEMKRSVQPLVSVCVYNYQYGRYLLQCLESVAAQTYPNIELCFADNGSSDDSWEIAMDFSRRHPGRMSLTRSRMNFGAQSNQDITMFDAAGKYMIFLCSDDAMHPTFIERCVTLLERQLEAAFAMVHRDVLDDAGNVTHEPSFYDQTCLIPGNEQTSVYMMTSVNPSISQILYRRERFHDKNMIGTVNSRWFGARILDFNLCCDYPMIYIKEPLLLNRIHNMSEGAMLSDTLLQCMGEYSLVHQFADKALSQGHHKTAARLGEAVEKIGKLCLRYCLRFLLQDDTGKARQYLHLAEAIWPEVVQDETYAHLNSYWIASAAEQQQILDMLKELANLTRREVSYAAPPRSLPC